MAEKTKSVVAVIVFAVAVGAGIFASRGLLKSLMEPSTEKKQKALAQGLEEAVKRINAKGPQTLDPYTRLDRASIPRPGEITYHHTLLQHSSRDIGQVELQTKLRPEVVKKVCGSPELLPALRLGAILNYEYTGTDGLPIDMLRVSQADCNFK
jgi:hypothetical protein